ncbi:MAG: GNAT family N-acetyltransferase [Albidovulum sp.]
MTAPDPKALAAIHLASFTVPRPWGADEIASLAQSDGVFLLTRPGGFAMGRALAGEAELLTLAVSPDARRTGLGRALLKEFLAEAKASGAEKAFLEVAADNHAALALYASFDFSETGRRKGYYSSPGIAAIDALILSRDIG